MTVATTTTGAVSHPPDTWHTIHWEQAHREVRRLQARIVKATQAGAENRVLLHPNCHRLVHSQCLTVEKPRPTRGVRKA
jgi:RNA-directed DNA polymerase